MGGEYLSCSGDAVELLVALENLTADYPIRFDVDVVALMPLFIVLRSRFDLRTRDNAGQKGSHFFVRRRRDHTATSLEIEALVDFMSSSSGNEKLMRSPTLRSFATFVVDVR